MENDWSKRLADRWGLAMCREDAELERQVAPRQPLRRLYRRLCHDPDVPFFPPGFGVILFIYELVFIGISSREELDIWVWPAFLIFLFCFSVVLGLLLNLLFWPIVHVLDKMLEGLCWSFDTCMERYWKNEK